METGRDGFFAPPLVCDVLLVPPATLKGNQAYDIVRREIVSCRLMPGTRFTETEVMERFAFGKASCRIALHAPDTGRLRRLDPAARLSGHAGHGAGRGRGLRPAHRAGAAGGAGRCGPGEPGAARTSRSGMPQAHPGRGRQPDRFLPRGQPQLPHGDRGSIRKPPPVPDALGPPRRDDPPRRPRLRRAGRAAQHRERPHRDDRASRRGRCRRRRRDRAAPRRDLPRDDHGEGDRQPARHRRRRGSRPPPGSGDVRRERRRTHPGQQVVRAARGRPAPGARRDRHRGSRRRDRRDPGGFGLRQEHAAQHHRRPDRAGRGRPAPRRHPVRAPFGTGAR